MARLNECILYRDFEHGDLLAKMAEIMTLWEKDAADLNQRRDSSLNVSMVWWKWQVYMDFQETCGIAI